MLLVVVLKRLRAETLGLADEIVALFHRKCWDAGVRE